MKTIIQISIISCNQEELRSMYSKIRAPDVVGIVLIVLCPVDVSFISMGGNKYQIHHDHIQHLLLVYNYDVGFA